jgi:hypothetical protein
MRALRSPHRGLVLGVIYRSALADAFILLARSCVLSALRAREAEPSGA